MDKLDENGIVSRNKNSLLEKGYSQAEVIDYEETQASVDHLEAIRLLLEFTCCMSFKLYQMDVKQDFLNGFMNEEVYVSQPSGFEDHENPNYVL